MCDGAFLATFRQIVSMESNRALAIQTSVLCVIAFLSVRLIDTHHHGQFDLPPHSSGFVNYYGLQRFGSRPEVSTADLGRCVYKRDWYGTTFNVLPGVVLLTEDHVCLMLVLMSGTLDWCIVFATY